METKGEREKWKQKTREAQQFAIRGSTSLKQEWSASRWEQTHSSAAIMNTYTGLREGWSSKFLLRKSIYVQELQENKVFVEKQSCYTILYVERHSHGTMKTSNFRPFKLLILKKKIRKNVLLILSFSKLTILKGKKKAFCIATWSLILGLTEMKRETLNK